MMALVVFLARRDSSSLRYPIRVILPAYRAQDVWRDRDDTTRAGTPTAISSGPTLSRTTAPAPITAPAPTLTPSRIFAPAPSHAPSPTITPSDVRPCDSTSTDGSEKSWSPPITYVYAAINTLRPILTRLAENTSQLNPMFAPSASSMSPFLHERMVFRPTNTPPPMRMPAFASPFASSKQLSSMTTLSP